MVTNGVDFIIVASDGLWDVVSNEVYILDRKNSEIPLLFFIISSNGSEF